MAVHYTCDSQTHPADKPEPAVLRVTVTEPHRVSETDLCRPCWEPVAVALVTDACETMGAATITMRRLT